VARAEPPYAIRTERLLVRCWEPADAPALKEAVDSSLEHLRPWLPWATHEPQTVDEKVALLRRFRGSFDLGQDYVYGAFDEQDATVVGGTGLHTRIGDDAFEIGYWIRASRIGEGLATELSAALTRAAFEVSGVDRVEIRVDPANERSVRIPRKLGFAEEATLRRRLESGEGGEPRDVVIFTLFRDAYDASPSAGTQLEAFDAAGARVL
jgi:RimJ/RimL family protein N-acetyltransferase